MIQTPEDAKNIESHLWEIAQIFTKCGTPLLKSASDGTISLRSHPDMFQELGITLEAVKTGSQSDRSETLITLTYSSAKIADDDGKYKMQRHAIKLTYNVVRRIWSSLFITGNETSADDSRKLASAYRIDPDPREAITADHAFRIIGSIAGKMDRRVHQRSA